MIETEKVIKGLECCATMNGDECKECPYSKECLDEDLPYGMPHLAADALALLKAPEPIQIIKVGYYDHGRCPKCGRYVSKYSNFCWYCGQAVKWK